MKTITHVPRKHPERCPDELGYHFGVTVREFRTRARLSQEQLALLSQLHRTQISKIERWPTNPALSTILKLAGPLEVGPADLLEGLAWQPLHSNPWRGSYFVDGRRAPFGEVQE